MPTTKCTHCGQETEYPESPLGQVNSILCPPGTGSPSAGEVVIGRYRLWFTGFKEAANAIDLVGQCVAWAPPVELNLPMYAIHTGDTVVFEVKRNERFPAPSGAYPVTDADLFPYMDIEKFTRVKKQAMDILAEFIREKEGVAA
jgi:hypothetical protein